MKKYLIQIALFLLPLLVFFTFIEVIERQIPNDFKYKSEYLNNHAENLEVLILGSSHSLSFIQPRLMKAEAFNAANLHQTLKFDKFIFDKYIERMKHLKVVIIPISYGSYFSSLEHSKDNWRVKDYKLYYGYENYNILGGKLEVTNGSTQAQFLDCVNYLMHGTDKITCSEKGFGIKFSRDPQTDLEKTGKIVADRHTKDCSPDYTDENIEALKSIISECEKRNIRVFLYTPPAWHTYRENLVPELFAQTLSITDKIKHSHTNVQYINYIEDPRFSKDDFRDVDHLSEKGANIFTEILKKDIGLE